MKDFINAATAGSGGSSIASAATGQLTIAIASFILMAAFGAWGAYLRWRDSKKFHEAIEKGDIQKAIEISGK